MENKSPAFQFYVQDFVTGTMYMSAEEVGGYIRLLCYQWDKGCVPNDVKKIKIISGIKRSASIETVLCKFKLEDDFYKNSKLEKVRKMRENFISKQRENGLKGGKPTHTQALPKTTPSHTPSSSSSSSSSINKKEKVKRKVFLPPTLNEFINYFFENGYDEDLAIRAFKGYAEADWHDTNGKKIYSWKQKAQIVWFKKENKNGNTDSKKGKENGAGRLSAEALDRIVNERSSPGSE